MAGDVVLKGAELLEKWAEDCNKELVRAMGIALKKTAYETMQTMRDDLWKNNLGLAPVSVLRYTPYSRKMEDRQYGKVPVYKKFDAYWLKKRPPLQMLYKGITYRVVNKDYNTGEYRFDSSAEIGFGIRNEAQWFEEFAKEHQSGYYWTYPERYVNWLHSVGIHLKKETKGGQVPARDIINNFVLRRSRWVFDTLKKYFELKKAGKTWK